MKAASPVLFSGILRGCLLQKVYACFSERNTPHIPLLYFLLYLQPLALPDLAYFIDKSAITLLHQCVSQGLCRLMCPSVCKSGTVPAHASVSV